jgi:hypothetical protein
LARVANKVCLLLISLSVFITAVRDSWNKLSSIFLSQTENEDFDGYENNIELRRHGRTFELAEQLTDSVAGVCVADFQQTLELDESGLQFCLGASRNLQPPSSFRPSRTLKNVSNTHRSKKRAQQETCLLM